MTGVPYTLAQWCLGALPVDAAGRRVFDETLADWRKEAAIANGFAAGAMIAARAMWSVVRCVVMVSSREIGSKEGMASLQRLAVWSIACALLFLAGNWNHQARIEGSVVRFGPVAALLISVLSVVAAMPLLAFVSGATGRRRMTQVPRLGPGLVMAAMMCAAMGWVLPAAGQAYRELMFAITSGGGTPPPGIRERSIVELLGLLFTSDLARAASILNQKLVWVVAVPVMMALGTTARSLVSWRRAVASVLPLLIFTIPFLAKIDSAYGHMPLWPALLAAALVTRALVRGAERERTADGDGSMSPGITA